MLTKAQEQFIVIWKRQNPASRVVMTGLFITAIVLAVVFFRWSSTPTYSVAFSNLSDGDAGQIVEKMDELQVPYQLRGSGTILVPSNQVYDVRLKMARESLPEGNNVGFELFSGNTLGMTEFTQRVNYQRALEGELERTIGSLAAIDSVEVHIVSPEKTLLQENQTPTTASVTVKQKSGNNLDAAQVRAITHLVASSVEGLKPESVVVVDINGNMLASGGNSGGTGDMAVSDTRRAAELAAAADLQRKVQEIMDTTLGLRRSVVKASVRLDWTERETVEQAYDPASATIRSSQLITESLLSAGDGLGGVPGSMTNLPPITNVISTTGQTSQYYRSEKTTNYEITQTETKKTESPGKIERISLSVMVDGVTDPQQLATLKSIAAAAAGIDESRGDLIEVQSMAFDRTAEETEAVDTAAAEKSEFNWRIGQIVAAAALMLLALWYVQRLLTNLRLASTQAWTPVLKRVSDVTLPAGASASPALMSEIPAPAELPQPAAPIPVLEIPKEVVIPALSAEDEKLQEIVLQLAEDNPAAIAEVIQLWLNEDRK